MTAGQAGVILTQSTAQKNTACPNQNTSCDEFNAAVSHGRDYT
jgi:hypothetical protein